MVEHTFNPITQEVEEPYLWVLGHPGLHSEFLDNQNCIVRPCFENKIEM